MTRRTVSANAEKHLTEWWEALIAGEIQLWGLPPCVAAFYYAGYQEGRESRDRENEELRAEVARLERVADIYWAHAFLSKDERRERLLQRIDRGLEQADAATWERIEKEIALMGRTSPQSSGIGHLNETQSSPPAGGHQAFREAA